MNKLILLVFLITTSYSCRKTCKGGGTTTNIYTNKVAIKSRTQVHGFKQNGFSIILTPTGVSEDVSPHNCDVQNLVLKLNYVEVIDTSDVKVFCNRALKRDNITIQEEENFLLRRDVFDITPDSFEHKELEPTVINFYTDSALLKGAYTFYVSGKTSLGNNFIDSSTITFN